MKNKTVFSLVSLACITLLGACSFFGSNQVVFQPTKLVEIISPSGTLSKVWQKEVGEMGFGLFVPAHANGTLAAVGRQGQVKFLGLQTGDLQSKVNLKMLLQTGVAYNGNMLFVGTEDARLLAVSKNGDIVWSQSLTSALTEPPLLLGDKVIARGRDGRITAYAVKDGKLIWNQIEKAPPLSVRPKTTTLTALGNDAFVAPRAGGSLVIYQTQTGNPLLEVLVAVSKGNSEVERASDVISQSAFNGKQLCAVAYQGRVACFSPQSGQALWSKTMSSSTGVTLSNTVLYTATVEGELFAFDAATGQLLWKNEALKYRQLTTPVVLNQQLLVVDGLGFAHILSPSTGKIIARLKIGTVGAVSQPLVLGSLAVLQMPSGEVMALKYQ
ncbi:MAG: outer membrane protein assembly factor BamB [Neisseriaceae bacterium]|nr:outer membrane protein assembly factor BamB [Neisseriaceae bacterium]